MILIKMEDQTDALFQKILKLLKMEQIDMCMFQTLSKEEISFPSLQLYQDQRQVLHNGVEVFLSSLEFDTLIYLVRQPGRVFTKDQIYQHVYQEEAEGDVNNIIYCLIRSLRKKLELDPRHPKYIHTVRGVGYKFEQLPEEEDCVRFV